MTDTTMADTTAWQYAHLSISAGQTGANPLPIHSSITTAGETRALPQGTVENNQSMVRHILTILDLVGAEGWMVSSYNSSYIGNANTGSWYEAWLRRPVP
jgi:hypothetical protein